MKLIYSMSHFQRRRQGEINEMKRKIFHLSSAGLFGLQDLNHRRCFPLAERQVKISEEDVSTVMHENIFRLQGSVDESHQVQILQSQENLHRNLTYDLDKQQCI